MRTLIPTLALATSCVFAQTNQPPLFRVGDDYNEFSARYDEWVQQIPLQDRAWPQLKDVDNEIDTLAGDLYFTTNAWDPDLQQDWIDSVEFISQNVHILDQLRLLPSFDALGISSQELFSADPMTPPGLRHQSIHLGACRRAVQILLIDSVHASKQGDLDRAIDNIKSADWLTRNLVTTNSMIEPLVAISLTNLIFDLILTDTLDLQEFNHAQLDSLFKIIAEPNSWLQGSAPIEGEHASIHATLKWFYQDHVNGRLSDGGLSRFEFFLGAAIWVSLEKLHEEGGYLEPIPQSQDERNKYWQNRIESLDKQLYLVNKQYEALRVAYTAPLNTLTEFGFVEEFDTELSVDIKYAPSKALMPAHGASLYRHIESRARKAAALILIGAHHHRAKQGALPDSLDEIELLQKVTLAPDPYTNTPFKYLVRNGTVFIYSVGPDRNNDAGRTKPDWVWDKLHAFVPLNEYRQHLDTDPDFIDYDWVLTPAP